MLNPQEPPRNEFSQARAADSFSFATSLFDHWYSPLYGASGFRGVAVGGIPASYCRFQPTAFSAAVKVSRMSSSIIFFFRRSKTMGWFVSGSIRSGFV